MKLVIEKEKCIGCCICQCESDVFEVIDGVSTVKKQGPYDTREMLGIQDACSQCPMSCIKQEL